ncbi:putative Rho GTPase-activating protein domain, Rho GTPase activation protein [Trachipleistophora hominis]|uniref:Putative Rho GTPase-activating protein domain, Rho GTPase activation protein n=1 Tax=Trachipleistophora hominis TaxID=72359 RepID=L7JUB3_TRAHO|nr:putative Rho GTPase-activating protein domain, Rho GTPase activation protein [Trachipleistophora hominis]
MDIMNEGSCEMTRFVRRVIPGTGNPTRNLPGNDRIADHRFKSRFKVEHITFKNYQDKFIRYDDLSPVEKYELYRYAVFMLTSTVSANKLSFFKKIMKFGNNDKTEVCHIHPFIFKIMDFIKTKRANYHGIFRCSGDYRASTRLYERFIAGDVFDLNTTDVRNIVAFFKIYLKKKVNGIFSFDILDTLYETAKHRSSPSINYLLFYLPFCFVGDKRRFLIGLIDMFKEIDQHKNENDMPIPNLVRCIAPSLFPDTRLKSIETVFYQTWAVQKLFDIDLEKVPKPLLEFSHVYVVEKSSFSIC